MSKTSLKLKCRSSLDLLPHAAVEKENLQPKRPEHDEASTCVIDYEMRLLGTESLQPNTKTRSIIGARIPTFTASFILEMLPLSSSFSNT